MGEDAIDKLRKKYEKSGKNILSKIEDVLKNLKYTCPSKEECETIKNTFRALRKFESKKSKEDKDKDKEIIDKSVEKVVGIIAAHPSTLEDGRCFDNGNVPKDVMKSIAKHCGFSYGSKRKVGDEKFTLSTVSDRMNYYLTKFKRAPVKTEKVSDKTVGDAFAKKIKKEVGEVLDKFKNFKFPTRTDVESGDLCARILRYVGRLSKILTVLGQAVKKLGIKKEKSKNAAPYVLVFEVPWERSLWGFVCSVMNGLKSYDQIGLDKIEQIEGEVKELRTKLEKLYSDLKSKEGGNDDNVGEFDVVSALYKLRSDLSSWVGKVTNVRGKQYAVEMSRLINQEIDMLSKLEVKNVSKDVVDEKRGKVEVNISKGLDFLRLLVAKLYELRSAKVMHELKCFVANNWMRKVGDLFISVARTIPAVREVTEALGVESSGDNSDNDGDDKKGDK